MLKKNIKVLFVSAIMLTFLCTGCGEAASEEEKELAAFSNSMSEFTQKIVEMDEKINSLDTSQDDASKELLSILEDLNTQLKALSEMQVPEQYQSISDLADNASEKMSKSLEYFHCAYDSDTFMKQDADIAYEYYTRAMKRIRVIGYILAGENPEGEDGVTFYQDETDSRLIDKLLQDE